MLFQMIYDLDVVFYDNNERLGSTILTGMINIMTKAQISSGITGIT